jgi:hypothetical protein
MAAVLDAHRIPPDEREQLVAAGSLRRLNQAGAQGGDFGRMLHQLNDRIGLRVEADTLERVTRSRHARVSRGQVLLPARRPWPAPPMNTSISSRFSIV